MTKYSLLAGSVGLGLFALLWLLSVNQQNIVTRGIDAYEYHRPIFGGLTQAQEIVITRELRGVGAILVNLRRADNIPDVHVSITDIHTHQELATAIIPSASIQDDQFTTVSLPSPLVLAQQNVRLTFAARAATSANPVGIRFHPDDPYPAGSRIEKEMSQRGDLALLLLERVPLWRYIGTTISNHRELATMLAGATLVASLITALASRWGWRRQPQRQRLIELACLGLLALTGTIVRFFLIPQFHGVSGGDPYNYLFIAQKLADLANPFEGVKRLPGYPLLLLPTLVSSIDTQWWMRALSALAAGGSIFLTGLLARRLHFPWSVQVIAAVLLIFQKDFLWTSLRPEPYTLYTFLLLLALVLFFNLHHRAAQLAFGITLGYAAMTRQEGFVAAAILGIFALIFWRQIFRQEAPTGTTPWSRLLPRRHEFTLLLRQLSWSFLPALVVVSPFFIHNTLAFGNPFYTPYFEGERLQIVDSWPAFQDSLGATWGILSSLWRPSWDQLHRIPLNDPLFITGFILTLLWWGVQQVPIRTKHNFLTPLVSGLWLVLLFATLWVAIVHRSIFNHFITTITGGMLLASVIPFIYAGRWRAVIVLTVGFAQLLVALWFHPFAKHYQQIYPLTVLLLATAIVAPRPKQVSLASSAVSLTSRDIRETLLAATSRISALTPLVLVIVLLLASLKPEIDEYNQATALDWVVYRAVRLAEQHPTPTGFDQAYLPAQFTFGNHAFYFSSEDEHTIAQEQQWLEQHSIRTLVVTNHTKAFRELGASWQLIKSFRSEGKDEFMFESRVYVRPAP
ncbi:MAG: hypothetical protein WEA04_00520 [Candidatus Andersenbacteria bacterium]